MSDVKYPNIKVQLTGGSGNIFAVIGKIAKEMRRAKVSQVEIAKFTKDVMSSQSYNEALGKCMKWVSVR